MITVLIAVAICFVGARAFAQEQMPAPDVGIDQRLNDQVPLDLVFCDEANQGVSLRSLFGERPVILVLAYYRCPRLCSVVLNSLLESLQRLDYEIGKDFTVVTVSF